MTSLDTSQPIIIQPGISNEFYTFDNGWHQTFFGSFKPCPRSAFACFCSPCYIAKLNDRAGEYFLTYCINPYSLMALRTKVRAAFHIRGSLAEDCYTTCCCLYPCAAMQIEKELDHQNIPNVVVQTKPGDDVWKFENWWTQQLHHCCEDIGSCCLVCWCCPCTMYKIYDRADEDLLTCCWPMTLWPLRTKIRTLFRIRGSVCSDCLAVYCCPCCALIQMRRELKQQGL
ncbi:unnamed protein product [Rotaria sordida]|uniref:Uncharacterized protein n=1 Tax=Rotaria sordida TaxID=392033 RepID=A0A818KK66_9BILA|nr:unnamed protein product [Rotaria sordida]CAF3561804.1 unnamed protein product [Rotaria sordida]